jgi:hypothetical protein
MQGINLQYFENFSLFWLFDLCSQWKLTKLYAINYYQNIVAEYFSSNNINVSATAFEGVTYIYGDVIELTAVLS